MVNSVPAFLPVGGPEMLIIAAFVLVLFVGPSKIPEMARSMGSAAGEFKKGRQQLDGELEGIEGEGSESEAGE